MARVAKKQLERARERELLKIYKDTQDPLALEELVKAHTPYVQKMASRQYINFGKIIEYEDLVQEGKIGLIKAINKFDLNRVSINPNDNTLVYNQALLTYAHTRILSEMQNLYHRSHPAHIPAHTLRAIAFKVSKPGCNTEERKACAKLAMRAESLDAFNFYSENDNSSGDGYSVRLAGDAIDPTFDESNKEIFSPMMQKAIKKLNPIEQKVLFMRYGINEGILAKPNYIASELNISIEEVEKILKRAKRLLASNKELKKHYAHA